MSWTKAANDSFTAILNISHLHNPESVSDLSTAIDEILADGGIRSVIFRSTHEKNWCIGIDIPWIMEQYKADNRAAVKEFFMNGSISVFHRMLTMPLVTISAISGHAFGNGVIFALCCDYRFMGSDRGYFCLPEAEMGLVDAFPPSDLILMDVHYDSFIRDVMIPTAKKVKADELFEKKIIDGVCENADAVMIAALKQAAVFSENELLYRKTIEERIRWSLPVRKVLERDDPGFYDFIIERFWELMKRLGVK